jgi:AAA+ superfamily predicted ATPase
MNTAETEFMVRATGIPVEINYLKTLINYRLNDPDGQQVPRIPDVETWNLPIKKFIKEHRLDNDQNVCSLLLIGLAPHVVPGLFDVAIQEKLSTSGDFPEIGGVRGKNFRGFLPTGQTAVYLLAGENLNKRKQIEQLFWSDKYLAQKKILWLEELQQSEPVMSGKITMALDYVDLFLFGVSAPPHFSTIFPARKITTRLTSDDIFMNDEVRRHYENLKDWIDNDPVVKEWDKKERFKHGFRVLFYGPPGTGKTLTANVLGNERGKHVYKIDLSMVVSKYIGETEKNLELLFARAEDKDWILFFDEADAIFGKRTNVRDAHDKYANQEVSYLLQRIEDFNGLVILATNMKNNIDDSFIRRFDDIVKFTFPNEAERKEIWEKSFPEQSDIDDIPNKVKKYELAGGNIINVIHYAAIQAVKRKKVSMEKKLLVYNNNGHFAERSQGDSNKLKFYLEDIIDGIRREMLKEGKPFSI